MKSFEQILNKRCEEEARNAARLHRELVRRYVETGEEFDASGIYDACFRDGVKYALSAMSRASIKDSCVMALRGKILPAEYAAICKESEASDDT